MDGDVWNPLDQAQPVPRRQVPPAPPDVAAAPARHGQGRARGTASAIERRTDRADMRSDVLSFRVECYDERGDRGVPVPVEVRGVAVDGALGPGDEVDVEGHWRDGVLVADRVTNCTTASSVRGRAAPAGLRAVAVGVGVFIAVVLAMVVTFVVVAVTRAPDLVQGAGHRAGAATSCRCG